MLGSTTNVYMTMANGAKVVATLPGDARVQDGTELTLAADADALHVFDADSSVNVLYL